MQNQQSVSFTTSMKKFEDETIPPSVENFFIIDQSIVIFNADLVDSTTVTKMDMDSVWLRLNLHDGTSIDRCFSLAQLQTHSLAQLPFC